MKPHEVPAEVRSSMTPVAVILLAILALIIGVIIAAPLWVHYIR
jgi:hypothetical protein